MCQPTLNPLIVNHAGESDERIDELNGDIEAKKQREADSEKNVTYQIRSYLFIYITEEAFVPSDVK